MTDLNLEMARIGQAARQAARALARLQTPLKNRCLEAFSALLLDRREELVQASQTDLERARQSNLFHEDGGVRALSGGVVDGMARILRNLAGQPDPVGRVDATWIRPNGLKIQKVRVPVGVLGIAYQGAPETTLATAGMCIKSGNAGLLCSDDRWRATNQFFCRILNALAEEHDLPPAAVQIFVPREPGAFEAFLGLDRCIDLLIPRGDREFVRRVVQHSRIPVVRCNRGPCHVYIDREADLPMGLEIVANAHRQNPQAANSAGRVLVHRTVCGEFLTLLRRWAGETGVLLKGDDEVCRQVPEAIPVRPGDWEDEDADLILLVGIVPHLESAVEHIDRYGGGNSEAIVTPSRQRANRFSDAVNAAAVYINASPRFTDGQLFGMGPQIAVSTGHFHARGPMGIEELTLCKYVIDGKGQIRED